MPVYYSIALFGRCNIIKHHKMSLKNKKDDYQNIDLKNKRENRIFLNRVHGTF